MDHFALPSDSLYQAMEVGTLHRNFMGYTASNTELLVGLGASAISDTWDAFIQNEKDVDSYKQAIEENKLPITISHALSEEDKVIRQHILNLMCRMETVWSIDLSMLECYDDIIYRLIDLEIDGLIKLIPNGMMVTEKGKAFIRNICTAFDQYSGLANTPEKLFSKSV